MGEELALVERGVHAVALDELGVRALLDEPSVVEHEDAVGREDGREPMGDYERCAAGEQRPQGSLARDETSSSAGRAPLG